MSAAALAPIIVVGLFGLIGTGVAFLQWRGTNRTTVTGQIVAELNTIKDEYKAQGIDLREQLAALTIVCAGLKERIVDFDARLIASEKREQECVKREQALQRQLTAMRRAK